MSSDMHRRDLLKGFAALLPLMPLHSALADTWPQFRGPGARGIGPDDPRLPETWSSREHVLWCVDIPGTGWASPVVWNDRIFIHTNVNAAGEGTAHKGMSGGRIQYYPPAEEHRSMALSIDFKTGRTLWATELHRGVPKPSRHPKNSYASETPVTDGRRVYFHIGDLATYCLDMKGRILWMKDWPLQATRYGYGTASSPVLHESRLYILKDNEEESYLIALDKITGREIWRVKRDEPTTWSTPYIWQNARRTEIVTSGSRKIRSYDLNGKLLWEITRLATLAVPTPFSDDGLLYVTSGYPTDPISPVYAIRPGASGDITLKNGETNNDYIAWSLAQGGPIDPSSVIYKGKYYSLSDVGFLTCHDAKTGKEIYGKQRLDPASGTFTTSPWAYNDRIFCLSEDGDTYVVQASSEFKVLRKNSMDDACMASPAIAGGSLILRTYRKLYRIGIKR
ncbi:MAG TPA: PQQ-binding-like beta-propeller repeat protein [Acidobacteriota bacterium]|nr:PQQ-binding-like beta-propeller repeat protein [Acidobacteriota bacterium]